ncbi:dihydrolipoamide acetyltransferase family protein [Nocardioides marmorisolisilvae]|uniref:Dihydrolipoamide acetyltransferase component of pyruvate dehydrogenase complex n=1 Tax=Nocardioides marmorisolisilvae TaxID=1542737 RepID=A0A3N0DQK3_9ACTN|nr:dihydrolipoamide acetyltransferase family protein [Nocardioides marmorisolisilvae]RNL77746.1 2-oxo acid dehydrogenase subunit E2 [Nocardioides marmorisolisilvae]
MSEFLLPDVGEGLVEAEIVTWKVKVGDEVKINDIVVEIETAKSLVELPSPYAGVVEALLVPEGETVAVGTPIIRIGDGAAVPTPAATAPDLSDMDLSNPAASGGGEGESLVGRSKAERGAVRRARRAAPEAIGVHYAKADVQDLFNAGAPQQHEEVERLVHSVTSGVKQQRGDVPPAEVPAPDPGSTHPIALAKPPVRKLAKDLGVDLTTCAASGPGGVITRADVEAAAGSSGTAVTTRPAAVGTREDRREPIKGVRKMMGQAMVASAFTAPHVTEWVTIDVTRTSEFVERLRGRREFADVKVSPLLILATACMKAIGRTPVINSYWDDAAQEIVFKGGVNLGIAAATPRGLVVPNIKDADTLSLLELAGALGDLTSVARSGKTQPADMAGGSFTITNVGVFGVDGGTPIINPGESAILCFGATKRQPWVVVEDGDERLEIRDVCTLTLSFDHRHVDGESGSRFLADVASMMEDPAAALLF